MPSSWSNPTGDYHLGVKNAYQLYPKKLQERIEASRKKRFWDEPHKNNLIEATRQLTVRFKKTKICIFNIYSTF